MKPESVGLVELSKITYVRVLRNLKFNKRTQKEKKRHLLKSTDVMESLSLICAQCLSFPQVHV